MTETCLQSELEAVAKEMGADLFGVADLTAAQDFVCRQGGEYLRRFPRAISIGVHLLDAVVNELHRHEEPAVIFSYRAMYNSVNSRLDNIILSMAKRIQQKGYRAYSIATAQCINYDKLIGVTSHKLVANLAGLGWIGKSCLLVTPDYGPRVRLATVLTDASLKPGRLMEGKCGDCRRCVDVCPPKAFTGASFNPSEPREARFNAHLCNSYIEKRRERLGERVCGLCVYVCPYGQTS